MDLIISHATAEKAQVSSHSFVLHGIRYASLHTPQEKDVIVIRNEGDHPVKLEAFALQEESFDNHSFRNET